MGLNQEPLARESASRWAFWLLECRLYSLERMDAFGKRSIAREEWLAVVLLSDS